MRQVSWGSYFVPFGPTVACCSLHYFASLRRDVTVPPLDPLWQSIPRNSWGCAPLHARSEGGRVSIQVVYCILYRIASDHRRFKLFAPGYQGGRRSGRSRRSVHTHIFEIMIHGPWEHSTSTILFCYLTQQVYKGGSFFGPDTLLLVFTLDGTVWWERNLSIKFEFLRLPLGVPGCVWR